MRGMIKELKRKRMKRKRREIRRKKMFPFFFVCRREGRGGRERGRRKRETNREGGM